jgi:hypothetical protein
VIVKMTGSAKHSFIIARLEQIQVYHEQLASLVGETQAAQLVIELGIAQSFQVMRTVKRKRRQVIEQAEEPTPAGEQAPQCSQQAPVKHPPKAKATRKAKQVIFVEETSQQIVYGFSNLTPAEASPEAIATFLRNHWARENRLHWRRDVTDAAKIIPWRPLPSPCVTQLCNSPGSHVCCNHLPLTTYQ